MQSRPFGRHGLNCSEIGFGAWAIGSHWGAQSDADSLAALHRALDLGCNFIDTAAGYGNGHSEKIIARVLRERAAAGKQERVFVATKTPPADGIWPPSPYCRAEERYSEAWLRANVATRLANLGVQKLDLLQLHTWTRAWNRNPTPFKVLRQLQREGLLGLIGVSTPEQDQNSVIDLMRGGWVDAVQVIYNLFEQEPAAELLDVARECGVAIIVRVAFDEGVLTGKFTADTKFAPDDFRARYFEGDRLARAVAHADEIKKDLVGTGYTLPQAALKWVLAHPAVSTVIPGIRSVAQAEANCGVSDLPAMPAALVEKLRRHNWRRGVWYGGK
ncbi:aldo/keto reductase [Oleiharenicola lentus]|jgi:aryl-alcohol dehydrogenase-like predicted oxidoreductase|uniref:Aldo/keto reductase n=1 Tax=Oleiharenicola lentus TaxID=2508720 RepID=A0A4Q1C5M9_9BACT|nr:aldo/keto reductase [Oleiharenicola lentus]RXK53721.1 aldo/keto reductase [Oleiharenicola lentus]